MFPIKMQESEKNENIENMPDQIDQPSSSPLESQPSSIPGSDHCLENNSSTDSQSSRDYSECTSSSLITDVSSERQSLLDEKMDGYSDIGSLALTNSLSNHQLDLKRISSASDTKSEEELASSGSEICLQLPADPNDINYETIDLLRLESVPIFDLTREKSYTFPVDTFGTEYVYVDDETSNDTDSGSETYEMTPWRIRFEKGMLEVRKSAQYVVSCNLDRNGEIVDKSFDKRKMLAILLQNASNEDKPASNDVRLTKSAAGDFAKTNSDTSVESYQLTPEVAEFLFNNQWNYTKTMGRRPQGVLSSNLYFDQHYNSWLNPTKFNKSKAIQSTSSIRSFAENFFKRFKLYHFDLRPFYLEPKIQIFEVVPTKITIPVIPAVLSDSENSDDGIFPLRRVAGCTNLAALVHQTEQPANTSTNDTEYRDEIQVLFSYTSLRSNSTTSTDENDESSQEIVSDTQENDNLDSTEESAEESNPEDDKNE